MKRILLFLLNFITFFCVIAFVITCSFLLFGSVVELPEEDIRAFAPAIFFNIFGLTTFFMLIDTLRRIITVERPAKEIQRVLKRLMEGDFSARISVPYIINRENHFRDIAESINLLAKELGGVETLRTDFIANVSHELKTPLAVMQNYGTMLQKPDISEEERIEYSKAITDTSRRLANLITNILKLNKIENQQIFPAVTEYDLGEQLCESVLMFENIWERKNIEIETDIEEGVIIKNDPELLSLVWNNLISNAVKFTPEGGTIAIGMKCADDVATVRIADTGCGMAPEVGMHIFEKFYQGDTSHATQGNGLGLALVKRVVDIMNGEISVESSVGKGSTFTVKIRRKLHERLEKNR